MASSSVGGAVEKIGVVVAGTRHTFKKGSSAASLLALLKDVFGGGLLKDADGDCVLSREAELPVGDYTYQTIGVAPDTSRLIPKIMPIMDGMLGLRVSRLERDDQCIGTAIRVSSKGIIMTTRMDRQHMQNIQKVTAFGGPLMLLSENSHLNMCFFKGQEGAAFEIAGFRTFGVGQKVDFVHYPRRLNRDYDVIEGEVVSFVSTGSSGTISSTKSIESICGGAVVVGEKLLVGMHIASRKHEIGKFLTSWTIRQYLGDFDKRFAEPLKGPFLMAKRSRSRRM